MTNYLFLTSKHEEENNNINVYYVVNADRIETLYMSDTYAEHGQSVGADDAGDSLTLNGQKAVEFANEFLKNNDEDEILSVGDVVSAYEAYLLYIAIVNSDLQEGEDFTNHKITCKGFNYWNGHNYGSIIVSNDFDEGHISHEIVDDEETISFLNEILQEALKGDYEEGFGERIYTVIKDDSVYEVVESSWQGRWENYRIFKKFIS
jgi:hypothetical protein